MRPALLFILFFGISAVRAQSFTSTDSIGGSTATDNIYNRPLFSDSLSSSFCIVIRKEVKAHKHLAHSEQVCVLEGEGQMKLGDKTITIRKGDVIFIPKNTVHAVRSTGKVPLKVLSVQSPRFDGSDRVMVE